MILKMFFDTNNKRYSIFLNRRKIKKAKELKYINNINNIKIILKRKKKINLECYEIIKYKNNVFYSYNILYNNKFKNLRYFRKINNFYYNEIISKLKTLKKLSYYYVFNVIKNFVLTEGGIRDVKNI